MKTATRTTTERVPFTCRVRFFDHRGACVKVVDVPLTARIPVGRTSARVKGELRCDDKTVVPFEGDITRGGCVAELNYQPDGVAFFKRTAIEIDNKKGRAMVDEIGYGPAAPLWLEVWVGGELQYSRRCLYAND